MHSFTISSFQFEVKPGCWKYTKVSIFDDGVKIGEYDYRYGSDKPPFYVFNLKNKWYALYATDYQCTRVMSLPDCQEVCKEEISGFCPVEYYVPVLCLYESPTLKTEYASFGFVSGCVWGDDTSWKLQYLDLSRVDEGIIKREERFGYFELPPDIDLRDAVNTDLMDGANEGSLILAKRVYVPIDGGLQWYIQKELDKIIDQSLKQILTLYCQNGLELTPNVIKTFSQLVVS